MNDFIVKKCMICKQEYARTPAVSDVPVKETDGICRKCMDLFNGPKKFFRDRADQNIYVVVETGKPDVVLNAETSEIVLDYEFKWENVIGMRVTNLPASIVKMIHEGN